MNNYCKLNFVLDPVFPLQDILPQELADVGFDSFEITDLGFNAFIRENEYSSEKVKAIVKQFSTNAKIEFETETIIGENWNKVWEESYEPIIVENKFAICAPFHKTPSNVELVILVEPRMAFGTGHHPTTLLMARHLIDLDCTNFKVLDMGCGTGVLAIIAEKKGAINVLAIDNEDAAIDNTKTNVLLNKCTNIHVEKGSANLLINRHFNIILANINRNVLWEHIPIYSNCLNKGDQLWLSGFYSSDIAYLSERIKTCSLNVINTFELDDWQLIKCVKE